MKRSLFVAALAAACGSSTVTPSPDATAARDAALDTPLARDVSPARDASPRCSDGFAPAYPDASLPVRELAPLPDLRFETATGSLALSAWYAPCAEAPRVLVIRSLAAWSGASQHVVAHTRRLLAHPQSDRFTLVDLLALGPDNTPATTRDLAAWSARYDARPAAVAVDPAYRFSALFGDAGELPLYAFVDPRTMRVVAVTARPSSEDLASVITRVIAMVDGLPRSTRFPAVTLYDDRFTRDEWEMIQAMAPLPAAPPPDPTNRVADDPRAARLGETLFFDGALSSTGTLSCASCHATQSLFTDGLAQGVGVARGDRNTPTVLHAPHARWLFWDGRADTLWAQALGPIENPVEMASTRLAVAHRIADRYADVYAPLFGPLPPLNDTVRFPSDGMPGDPRWEAMRTDDRDAVDRVFANVGKLIAAYERTLRYAPSALDRYAAGDVSALTETQRDGLKLFFVNGCAQCHHGPMLSDDSFHNVGFASGRRDRAPDRGRVDAIAALVGSPFRSDGPFSDDRAQGDHLARALPDESLLGRFHTPSLRGVGRTGPWGHGGTFTALTSVVRHYALGLQEAPIAGTTGTRDVHLPWFTADAHVVEALVALLNVL